MAVRVVAGPTVFSGTPQGFTVPAGASHLVVVWGEDSWGAPARPNSSCTWDGATVPRVDHIVSGWEYGCAAHVLVNPKPGTYNVAVGFSSMGVFYGGILALAGARRDALYATDSAAGNGSSSSRVLKGRSGGYIFAIHQRYYWDGVFTPGAGMTGDWSAAYSAAGSHGSAGMHKTAPVEGDNTIAASWTAGPDDWSQIILSFAPAPASGGVQVIFERWKQLLKDLREGRLPPAVLQRRYQEAMQI